MPIYCDTKNNWKLVKSIEDIKPTDIMPLRNIITEAKESFEYSKNKAFTNSIVIYSDFNVNMARYNIAGTGIDESVYITALEAFIYECNKILAAKNKARYKKLKYDIMGNWTQGQIILMIQK